MNQRQRWEFRYPVEKVKEAAQSKAANHREREAYWKDEAEKAKTELGERGIEIEEFQVTGGERHDARLNPALKSRLDESNGKVKDHGRKADEFESWVRVLESGGTEGTLILDWEDVTFFGLGEEFALPQ